MDEINQEALNSWNSRQSSGASAFSKSSPSLPSFGSGGASAAPIGAPALAAAPSPAAAKEAELSWVTEEISKVYKQHNPEKLDDILNLCSMCV